MIPFGPQLIGQTEKALGALLVQVLQPHSLTPTQWVTLQVAARPGSGTGLESAVRDAAHLDDAGDLVDGLTDRGLIADGALTRSGRALRSVVARTIAERTGAIWSALDADDAATAGRVLGAVLDGVRTEIARAR